MTEEGKSEGTGERYERKKGERKKKLRIRSEGIWKWRGETIGLIWYIGYRSFWHLRSMENGRNDT